MIPFHPRRRWLGLPAWSWLLPLPILLGIALLMGRPHKLAEPLEVTALFQPPLFVTLDGDSYRFVPFEQRDGVKPLWTVTRLINERSDISWTFGADPSFADQFGMSFNPGLYRRQSQWTYALEVMRFDNEPGKEAGGRPWLPREEVERIRPVVVQALNQRPAGAERGTKLEHFLNHGIEQTSYVCWQNAVILVAWLSLLLAVVAVAAMFVRPATPSRLP